MAAISSAGRAGASAALGLLLGCGTPQGIAPGSPAAAAPKPLPPRPLAEVVGLGAAGTQPDDSVIALVPGAHRVIVLRRSAPDFGLFARIELGDSTLQPPAGAPQAALAVHPRPGEYGLELDLRGSAGQGGTILFSYGSHFVAPAGAREHYGSDIFFERQLAIGRLDSTGQVVFLPTRRPGSDMLQAPLAGPGRYLVAAPR
jgi:hypothetical protein